MLVTMETLLHPAMEKGYAVIAPDFLTAGMLRQYITVAQRYRAPLIASYPPLPIDALRSFRRWLPKLRAICEAASVPVCLHLDHGKDVETCRLAIEAGFSSVMIDGSALSLPQNLAMTLAVKEAARPRQISVEAEIGHVGSGGSTLEGRGDATCLTDPDEARDFVARTGVDALAVSIGTQHGRYTGAPRIDFERLACIQSRVSVPLVLHGGSGTGDDNIRRAVTGGIRKINVFTDIIRPYLLASRDYLLKNPHRPSGLKTRQQATIDEVLRHYFEISGSLGRA